MENLPLQCSQWFVCVMLLNIVTLKGFSLQALHHGLHGVVRHCATPGLHMNVIMCVAHPILYVHK